MQSDLFIPSSLREAATHVRQTIRTSLSKLSKPAFLKAWCSVAYIYPGLHPDDFDAEGSGWPRVMKRYAEEAWLRAESGELTDEELYPGDAQWSGIYDRLAVPTEQEASRRWMLAAQ